MVQEKGNFITQINRDKRPGDNKPVYTGRLVKPGTDEEYGFALFLGKSEDGKRYFSGGISRQPLNGTLDAQLDALMVPTPEPKEGEVREFRLFLLENQFKEGEGREGAGERPTLWGRAQLGRDEPEIQISVWEKESRYQINPHISKYLTGQTQYALAKDAPVEGAEKKAKAKASAGRADR